MSLLCRIFFRGLFYGRTPCHSVTGPRGFCCGIPRMDRVRLNSTGSASPVNLTYDVFDGKGTGTPLVFLHGLFGSKSNFHSIAKSLVQRTGRKLGADYRCSQPWTQSTQSSFDL
ncbi:hypothetical protein AGOR_G00025010 [Albula goreensis]|uniref:Uncharacterized protein n=1 Tax=Albula goreensis TaxID=1534307 RepID=A0A8T3E1X9_9TELE|nr:hypothetical protein AGOR_G00025010 [Albula goreensis]